MVGLHGLRGMAGSELGKLGNFCTGIGEMDGL